MRAWLYKILFNVHYGEVRRERLELAPIEETIAETIAYDPPTPQHLTEEEVLDALERIPRDFQVPVALADVEELTYREIADAGPAEMPDSVREYDPACARLDKVAAKGAGGMALRSAHVCEFGDRKFAHLVYTRGVRLVSLLVTVRDCRALKSGAVPAFSGPALGPQRFTLEHIALGAYQTLKRIILVA